MRSSTRRPLITQGILAAASATALVAVLTGPAIAAPGSASKTTQTTLAASAELPVDDGLPTSEEDKVKAAREIGVEADNVWLGQTDRNFVFKIWQHAAAYPVVRDAAELVLAADDDTIDAACRAFILRGIFDAKKADDAKKISDEIAARQARELRRSAYAAAGLTIDTDGRMLLLSERDAVIEIFRRAAGTRVKAAAEAAIRGDSDLQHTFLTTGVKTAAEQDVQDAIKAAEDASAAVKARIAREGAMRAAAAVLGVVADDGKLVMTDDNFIRWIWETVDRQNRPEARAAAERALRNSDPAAWRAFIDTGIHTANRADLNRELAQKEAADRRLAEEIKTKAITDGFDNLLTAATQALAAGGSELDDFVRIGQYQVAGDDYNRPSGGSWQWRNYAEKCLSLRGGNTTNGTPLIQRDCAIGEDQQWIAMRVYNTSGRYRLISNKDRTKCVSLANSTNQNGTAFVIRTCDGQPDQNFLYRNIGENYIWINEHIQKAITVQNFSRDNDAPAIAWDINNNDNQQWDATNNRLAPGQKLEQAHTLHSGAGDVLILQVTDGNLVIYKDGHAVWATYTTDGVTLINQSDGNLVLYRADKTAAWASNTAGNGPSTLRMQDDGNLVLYRNSDNRYTWNTRTGR